MVAGFTTLVHNYKYESLTVNHTQRWESLYSHEPNLLLVPFLGRSYLGSWSWGTVGHRGTGMVAEAAHSCGGKNVRLLAPKLGH